jgi:hypothetical protein
MRYLLLIYGDQAEDAKMTEAEQAANMDNWFKYDADFNQTGKVLGGEALMPTSTATTVRGKSGGGTLATDGPFAETKESLGGYYVIDAANLDEAIEWAGKMPHIARGGCVEIRPIMEFDQRPD